MNYKFLCILQIMLLILACCLRRSILVAQKEDQERVVLVSVDQPVYGAKVYKETRA